MSVQVERSLVVQRDMNGVRYEVWSKRGKIVWQGAELSQLPEQVKQPGNTLMKVRERASGEYVLPVTEL